MINALLGSRILPEAVVPATATVNRVTYGNSPQPRAVVCFKDGAEKEIAVNDLKDYVTKLTENSLETSAKIREVTVYSPSVLCQNHVDIIDTPGLDEDERMTQITLEMVSQVDAIIIPIHARAPFDLTERDFVCRIIETSQIRNLMFVVTFMDQLDEDDYEYDSFIGYIKNRIHGDVTEELKRREVEPEILEKAEEMLHDIEIVGISSKLALESFVSGDRKKLKASRFEEFKNGLLRVCTAKQMEHTIRTTVDTIDTVIEEFSRQDKKFRIEMEQLLSQSQDAVSLADTVLVQGKARKDLDKIFAANQKSMDGIANRPLAKKDEIMKIFIKHLSAVRENTSGAIRDALNRASADTLALLRASIDKDEKELETIFDDMGNQLTMREIEFEEGAEACGFDGADGISAQGSFEKILEGLMENARKNLHTCQASPFLNQSLKRPMARNLIHLVEKDINALLAACQNKWNDIFAAIRVFWFKSYETFIAKTAGQIHTDALKRTEEATKRLATYQDLFEKYFPEAQTIQSRSKLLWEEFRSSK